MRYPYFQLWQRGSGKHGGGRPAETLVEVIMALFILALGSATATTLIITSLHSNSFSRDNLIALNMAVEGMEAVHNIRDTNWLKFGYDKTNCWNLEPLQPLGVDCNAPENLIAEGTYTVDLNPITYAWSFTPVVGELNLANELAPNDSYQLGFVDVTPSADTNGDNLNDNDEDLYISQNFITGTLNAQGFPSTGVSRFYRMISISYSDALPPEESQQMAVTSLVQWKDSSGVHRVQLSVSLANYLPVSAS